MAISVFWSEKRIYVPRTDMLLVQSVPSEVRELDINTFRLVLKTLEADVEGMPFDTTHNHNQPVTVGGVTLARVVEIINNYVIEFEDGTYAVNLVGANSNIADVTVVNQVSIRSANSAGLTYSEQINAQSFTLNRIYIDTSDGQSGTQFPRGTPTDPVNNYDDAYFIGNFRKLHSYDLRGQVIFTAGQTLNKTDWFSPSPISGLMLLSGQNTTDATFTQLGIQGQFNGRCSFETCALGNITDFQGIANNCGFNGNVTLAASATQNILFSFCKSVIAGNLKPVFDCNGTLADIHFKGYHGGLDIRNFSGGNNMSIDIDAGDILIDSSCTAGVIVVRGWCNLVDNSGAGCTVVHYVPEDIQSEVQTKIDDIRAAHYNRRTRNSGTGVETLYEDDGTTIKQQFNTTESGGEIIEVDPI